LFNAEYRRKTGMPVFPGSLNVQLTEHFDWNAPEIQARATWFGMDEYGGERDILLMRCVLQNLSEEPAFLWTTTTAVQNEGNKALVEVIAGVHLRSTYGLADGDEVTIRLLNPPKL
jgi:CTP-dependent riboflavin kinase